MAGGCSFGKARTLKQKTPFGLAPAVGMIRATRLGCGSAMRDPARKAAWTLVMGVKGVAVQGPASCGHGQTYSISAEKLSLLK